MLALLIALVANAGSAEDFSCAKAQFIVASSVAGQLHPGVTDDQVQALDLAKDRAVKRAFQCQGWEVPAECAEVAAPAAVAEADARLGRTAAAKVLAESKPLPTLGLDMLEALKLMSRIDAVFAEADRSTADLEALQLKRDEAAAKYEAALALVEQRHRNEAAFAVADRAWLKASKALNEARCEASACTRAGKDGAQDPACPGAPHPGTTNSIDQLHEARASTGNALAELPERYSLSALSARIAELGASGDRPSHLPYRSVDLWRLVIDSAARPSNEHARINAVLAQADGLQRMPPALMRWARTVPTWHSTWSRAVDKVQPDLDRIIEAWAHSDVTHGDRANENASDRISRARSDFRSHSPTALARVPAQ